MWQKCLLFQLSHCVYIHFTCLFIWCWAFRLIPLFGYMEEYCYKHECTSISLKWYFQLLEYVPRSAIADSLGTPIFRKTYDMFFFLNPTATVRFYVHTNITQGLQFLFILTNAFLLYATVLTDVKPFWLEFTFLWLVMWNTFLPPGWSYCMLSLEEWLLKAHAHF